MKYMHMISRERGHSEGQGGGVKGRLEFFRKLICFGTVSRHPFPKGGGRGVIFNPKTYVADFGNFKQGFLIPQNGPYL